VELLRDSREVSKASTFDTNVEACRFEEGHRQSSCSNAPMRRLITSDSMPVIARAIYNMMKLAYVRFWPETSARFDLPWG
jgi:hypothetical protein